jgi:hypothetical protein
MDAQGNLILDVIVEKIAAEKARVVDENRKRHELAMSEHQRSLDGYHAQQKELADLLPYYLLIYAVDDVPVIYKDDDHSTNVAPNKWNGLVTLDIPSLTLIRVYFQRNREDVPFFISHYDVENSRYQRRSSEELFEWGEPSPPWMDFQSYKDEAAALAYASDCNAQKQENIRMWQIDCARYKEMEEGLKQLVQVSAQVTEPETTSMPAPGALDLSLADELLELLREIIREQIREYHQEEQ